ncbi:MAG: hypothetical protein H0V91_02760, partial [Flavisolibacter sp.]|nr:hypothetical protein [Flavisolibacter sp.]
MLLRLSVLKTILVLSIIIIFGWRAPAQKIAEYETISTTQGLSQGMVFDLLQDREGFIWAATKNGLNRYDGYGFKVFSNDAYNDKSLSSNTIIKLFEDSKGRIWAGTEDAGLNVYDKMTGNFFRIQHRLADASSISGNAIRLIEGLPDGRVLVAVDRAGLNVIELKKDFFEKGANPVIIRLSLPNDAQVYGIGKDKNGTMWIGGMDGSVYIFNPIKNSFTLVKNAQLLNNGYYTPGKNVLI